LVYLLGSKKSPFLNHSAERAQIKWQLYPLTGSDLKLVELPSAGKRKTRKVVEPATWIEQATCGLRISDRGIAGRPMKAGNPLPSLGGTLIHSLCSVPRYQAAFVCFSLAF
jgi:hypothetical protein